MADLDLDFRQGLEEFVEDPQTLIPAIIERLESVAAGEFTEEVIPDDEFDDPSGGDLPDPENDPLLHFIEKYNPLGMDRGQLISQLGALGSLASLDDGATSVHEILGSLTIMGGIVPEDTQVSAQGMSFAAKLLEDMGISDQIDVLGPTIAYYVDNAKIEVQEFLDANPLPIEPSPESLTPEGQWDETNAEITGNENGQVAPDNIATKADPALVISTSI